MDDGDLLLLVDVADVAAVSVFFVLELLLRVSVGNEPLSIWTCLSVGSRVCNGAVVTRFCFIKTDALQSDFLRLQFVSLSVLLL